MKIPQMMSKTAQVILALAVLSMSVPVFAQDSADDPYKMLVEYDFGKSRVPLTTIESEIRAATPVQYGKIEARLLEALESPDATFACKQFVCRMLRRIGTERSVPVLAGMLADEHMSHMARFALQRIPGSEVDEVLRTALGKLDGDLRIGMIGSIGARGDRDAVDELAKLVRNRDAAVAEAALSALGRIGGRNAARTLRRANVAAGLDNLRADAYLMCADSLFAEGNASGAVDIYREMARESNPTTIRIAAYRGIVRAEKDKALPAVLALLRDENVEMQQTAATLLPEIPGSAAARAVAEQLPALAPGTQIVLLGKLADRGDKAAAPAVVQAAASEDEYVRVAAIRTLGVLGDASTVPVLVEAAASGGAAGDAAMGSLARLSGDGVDRALIGTIRSSGNPAIRAKVVEVLATRGIEGAVSAVFRSAKDGDSGVRRAAYRALGTLAGEKELPDMVDLLLAAGNSAEQRDLERAMVSVVGRINDADASAAPLIAGLAKADDAAKSNLLVVLGRTGSERAWRTVRNQLASVNVDVKKAAIRAMGNWTNGAPADDLMDLARNDPDPACQVLALRGYVRLIGLPSDRSAEETLALYKAAMEVARRPDEKKLVLAGVSNIESRDALDFVRQYLEDDELVEEAEAAQRKIEEMLE